MQIRPVRRKSSVSTAIALLLFPCHLLIRKLQVKFRCLFQC